ncbi:MAG TPA: alpha/beta fold hydrolase, partial [Micromonosporaceae bacterium]
STFREPAELSEPPAVDGVDLTPMATIDLTERAGWYVAGDRRILLTQVPEAYWGEPMILVEEAGRIDRAYALDDHRLLTDDGDVIELRADGGIDIAGTAWHRAGFVEQQVSFDVAGVRIDGTVITPGGDGPYPAAVVLHGAAGGQRDFCRMHAGALLDAGVAVLIYDKAGHGRSEGAEPTIFDQANAAEAAIEVLAARPDIDTARIGVAGFSNGMWAAPMVAARRPDVAFIAGVGAPVVSMAASEVHRRTKILREAGAGPDTLAAVAEAWGCIFATVSVGPSDETSARLAVALATVKAATDLDGYEVPDYIRNNPMLSPIPPEVTAEDLVAMVGDERDPELGYEPAADYARVTCPVLLQYGEHDTSVPVEASVSAASGAVPADRLTTIVYPGLEHMLNVVPDGLSRLSAEEAMYLFHRFSFGSAVWTDLATWCADAGLTAQAAARA